MDPEYLRAFATIMSRIENALGAKRPAKPVIASVAGGAALHFYTGARFSNDLDARIMARVLLDAQDLQVAYRGEDGHARPGVSGLRPGNRARDRRKSEIAVSRKKRPGRALERFNNRDWFLRCKPQIPLYLSS